MAVTRINNNQISDASTGNVYLGLNAGSKIQGYTITSTLLANNLTYGSDLVIAGNLTVQGNTTTIDTVNVIVEDPLILLAAAQVGSPTLDIGFIGKRGTSDNIAFVWDESESRFVTAFTTSEVTNTTISINSYASLQSLNITALGNLSVTGTSTLTGNVTVGNIAVNASSIINVGNNRITNVAEPSANSDAATKLYVDTRAGGFTISDGANTQLVETGNTVTFNGTANQVSVVVGATDQVTVALTPNVSISGNVLAGNINSNAAVTGVTITGTTVTATGNVLAGNVNSNAAVTGVTGVFSGNVLAGNLNSNASVTGTTVTATGNLVGGNAEITAGVYSATVSATGNVLGGNINSNAAVTGVTVIATGNLVGGNANITGDVNAATGTFTGNVISGNLNSNAAVTGITGIFSGNVSGANINTNNIVGSNLTITSTGNLNLSPTSNVSFNNVNITSLATPVLDTDAATKGYVDSIAQGLDVKASVVYATNATLPAYTYNNGTSGVGATLTLTSVGNLTIDGNVTASGQRILVKNETGAFVNNTTPSAAFNGIYVVTTAGAPGTAAVLTRTTDFDNGSPSGEIPGAFTFVEDGSVNADTGWVCTTSNPVTVGTTQIVWAQFSGAGQYQAGNGLSLDGTTFNVNVDNDTIAIVSDNVVVKTGANLVTPNIGNATGNSLTLTGNGLLSASTVSVSGNVLAGNVNSNAAVTGITGVFSGNLDSANLNASAGIFGSTVTATGNLVGGNAEITAGVYSATVSASGNVLAGNLNSNASVTGVSGVFSGNVDAGNVNITTALNVPNLAVTGNVLAGNVNSNAAVTGVTGIFSGNVLAGNLNSNASVTGITGIFSGNVDAGNVNITTALNVPNLAVAGNVLAGNINSNAAVTGVSGSFTGNVNVGNLIATGVVSGANIVATADANLGNIRISGDNITGTNGIVTFNSAGADVDFKFSGDVDTNLLVLDAGSDTVNIGTATPVTGAKLQIASTDSMLLPVGNTGQRPGTPATGMFRFNTTSDSLEYYDSNSWTGIATDFTVIVVDEFVGNGVQTNFTLSKNSTTAGTIVSINGIVQIPTTSYAVSGNLLAFTEAPESTDYIDARILTTSTTVTSLSNSVGNAIVSTSETAAAVDITGNLIPAGNVAYNLGSSSNYWKSLYVGGNTIYLGSLQLKDAGSNTFAVFTSDGTTQANLDVGTIDVSAINSGTSVIGISGTSGNAYITVGGVANVLVASSTAVAVTGNITASGDVTAQNVNSLSDATLKMNIGPILEVESVINSLSGVGYDWKNGTGHSYGFLAQDVEKVLPEAVRTDSNGLKSVNYAMIIPFLVETIKNLGSEVTNLKKLLKK